MKFPNHIILDVSKSIISNSTQYWIINHLNLPVINKQFFNSFIFNQKYLYNNQKKYTIKHNLTNKFFFLSENEYNFYISFFKTKFKIKNRDNYSKYLNKNIYNFFINKSQIFDKNYFKSIFNNLKFKTNNEIFKTNKLWNLFEINFIKKEKIYTKLKYSRVPQYDIVSGGVAAIFAGFLGFLISEKFGIELVDSGDFYFLFMYVVFLCFFLRLFLKIVDNEKTSWNIFSVKWLIYFYQILINLFFKKINLIYNRYFQY